MNDLDFGLSDLVNESESRTAAGWVARGLGVLFLGLSGLTTGAFFMLYSPGLGVMFGPEIGPYIAAGVGILSLDVGCLSWGYIRSHAATTREQMTLAGIVAGADLLGSLLVSALYVILQSGFDVGVTTPAGELTQLGQALHLTGVIVITSALIINFAGITLWANLSADTRRAAQATGLSATVAAGRYAVADARTRAVVQKTLLELSDALPQVTDAQAAANARRYLRAVSSSPARGHETPDVGPYRSQSGDDLQPEQRPQQPQWGVEQPQETSQSVNGNSYRLR